MNSSYSSSITSYKLSQRILLLCVCAVSKSSQRIGSDSSSPHPFTTASFDQTIRVTNIDTKKAIKTLTCHTDAITTLVDGKDGTIWAGCLNGQLLRWEACTYELLYSKNFILRSPTTGKPIPVYSIVLLDEYICIGSGNSIVMFDPTSLEVVHEITRREPVDNSKDAAAAAAAAAAEEAGAVGWGVGIPKRRQTTSDVPLSISTGIASSVRPPPIPGPPSTETSPTRLAGQSLNTLFRPGQSVMPPPIAASLGTLGSGVGGGRTGTTGVHGGAGRPVPAAFKPLPPPSFVGSFQKRHGSFVQPSKPPAPAVASGEVSGVQALPVLPHAASWSTLDQRGRSQSFGAPLRTVVAERERVVKNVDSFDTKRSFDNESVRTGSTLSKSGNASVDDPSSLAMAAAAARAKAAAIKADRADTAILTEPEAPLSDDHTLSVSFVSGAIKWGGGGAAQAGTPPKRGGAGRRRGTPEDSRNRRSSYSPVKSPGEVGDDEESEVAAYCIISGPPGELWSCSETQGKVQVWCSKTRRRLMAWELESPGINHLAFSRGHIWAAGSNGSLYVWDAYSRQPVFELRPHKDTVRALAVIGLNYIVSLSGSRDGSIVCTSLFVLYSAFATCYKFENFSNCTL